MNGIGRGRIYNFGTDNKDRACGQSAHDIDPWNKPNSSNYASRGRGFRANDADYGFKINSSADFNYSSSGVNNGTNNKGRGFGQSMYDIDPWNKPNSSNYASRGRGVRMNNAGCRFNKNNSSTGFINSSVGFSNSFSDGASNKDEFPSSSTFGGGRECTEYDNKRHQSTNNFADDPFADDTRTPSSKNGEFYSSFGGFGGFPTLPLEEPKKTTREKDYKPSSSGCGFQDWKTVEKEMKEAEIAKWADLPSIIKDFYSEDAEITAMTEDEADTFRLSKNNIMVEDTTKTRPAPKPVKTFEQAFKNQPEILEEIRKQKFVEPSPIQSQMWPIALSGYDVIGIAQTGTGKTLGFLLPIFVHLENQALPRAQRNGPGCLILSPTRELAIQIHHEIKKFRYKGTRSICIYGGGDRGKQIEDYLEGIDIIIATPGRLNDLVCADVIKLRSISFVVLDEADRMLDMGFEPQIKKILLDIRPDRHTIMTSATWPKSVRELGDRYTKDAFIIVIGSLDLTACHAVTQVIDVVHEDKKREHLFEFIRCLKQTEKVIVFVGKKSLADDLSSDLFRIGIKCAALHGDRDQIDREQALDDIKKGKVRVLVATDVASRGLDIVDITHVYNFDFPRHMEEYVHRVGRTGRAGRVGVSITLMTKYDWQHAGELINILDEAHQEIPDELKAMALRYAKKIEEDPTYGRRGGYRRKEPYFMEDYL